MENWIDYWSSETQFAGDDHKVIGYQAVFEDLKPYIKDSDIVLDFGCGEALFADKLSQHCEQLFLYDKAQSILDKLSFAESSNIHVIHNYNDLKSLDLVLISSVSQYLVQSEFKKTLQELLPLMSENGQIIIADVIPFKNSILREAIDLMKIAFKYKFLTKAILKMIRSYFGKYYRLRKQNPLTKYDYNSFKEMMQSPDLEISLEKSNIGLNHNRLTFVLRKVKT